MGAPTAGSLALGSTVGAQRPAEPAPKRRLRLHHWLRFRLQAASGTETGSESLPSVGQLPDPIRGRGPTAGGLTPYWVSLISKVSSRQPSG